MTTLNLFSLEKIVLQTIQEAKQTNRMIKIQSFKLLDKYQEEKTQEIENIIRNNNQVILKLDLIISELRKQKIDKEEKKLEEMFRKY
jgi:hypothetical protein